MAWPESCVEGGQDRTRLGGPFRALAGEPPERVHIYPYGEGFVGVLMVAGAVAWLSVPVALFIGTVGAVSVFKAVYIDKREFKCACVGGAINVPLGLVSLTENLMMFAMDLDGARRLRLCTERCAPDVGRGQAPTLKGSRNAQSGTV